MKEIGYGKGYRYPHEAPDAFVPDQYLPEEIVGRRFYEPTEFGFEREIAKRIEYWDRLRDKKKDESP